MRSLLIALSLAASAFGHGFVYIVTIDGKQYKGNVPNANPNPSIDRQIDDVSPVKGASNPYLNCGQDAQLATLVGSAMPGSQLTFDWRGGDLSNWPHNTGPMLTYMTSCGSTTCDKFNSTNSQWFKINQVGRQSPGGPWVQAELLAGGVANVTLPSTLAPGNYIIRHEIIALHLGNSLGGAEFYPSCSQLTVGGSQTGAPTQDELVTFPGAYKDTDPGIFDPNVFDPNAPYVFPGPNVAAFVGNDTSGDSSSSSGGGNSTSPSATSSAPTPTSTKSSSGSCKLKKRSMSSAVTNAATVRPRHFSRVMRGLIANRRSPSF